MTVASRSARPHRRPGHLVGRQADLKPALGRIEHALGHEGQDHEEDQAAQDPAVTQAVGALAHGQEREAEDRDAVDGPAGPVDAGAEVAAYGLGQRHRRDEGRRRRAAVAAAVTVVASPTTTQATWSRSTTSKAAPAGWWCMRDMFSYDRSGAGDAPVTVASSRPADPVP